MSVDSERSVEGDLEDQDADDSEADQLHRCECGFATPSMDRFVDHVSDAHNALDIAIEALLAETVEVISDAE